MAPEFTEITRSAEQLTTIDLNELEKLFVRKINLGCGYGSGYNHELLADGAMTGLCQLVSSGRMLLIGSSLRERMATGEFKPKNDIDIQIIPNCDATKASAATWLSSTLNGLSQFQEPYTDGTTTYTYYQFPDTNENVFFQVKSRNDNPNVLPNFAIIIRNNPKASPRNLSTNAPVVEFGLPFMDTKQSKWIPATEFDPQLTHGVFGIIDTDFKVIRVYRNHVENRFILPPPTEMEMALRILTKGFLEDCTFTSPEGVTHSDVVPNAKTQRKLLDCVDDADRNGYAFPLITDQKWNYPLSLFWPALDLYLLAVYPNEYHNPESGFASQFGKLYDQARETSVGFPLSAIMLGVISEWNKKYKLRFATDEVLKALRRYDVNQGAAKMSQDEFIKYLLKVLASAARK